MLPIFYGGRNTTMWSDIATISYDAWQCDMMDNNATQCVAFQEDIVAMLFDICWIAAHCIIACHIALLWCHFALFQC